MQLAHTFAEGKGKKKKKGNPQRKVSFPSQASVSS